ncbi:S-layer homology domain-containing protein [Chakrabartyella piscis]|uniref:S-layer homology domain-containing protein n=1 Tax=Chakrabartyella piscis TaxID=2918914 RepID=UPI002958A05C|nr:S-layer homology domain-containing protein [Chakrabartyella piscis]
MKKVAWILSALLMTNSAFGFGGLTTVEAATTTGGNSTYTVSIPQSVNFGELDTNNNNNLNYTLEIEYTDTTNTPSVSVTSPANGVLVSETGAEIVFSNNLSSTTLTQEVDVRTGTLTVEKSALQDVEAGDYTGNLTFNVGLASTDGSGNNGSTDEELGTQKTFADGNYYVDMYLWNAYADQVSMGNRAFENNQQALVTFVDDAVTTVQFATNPVDISGITSALWELYIGGVAVQALERTSFTTSTNGYTFDYLAKGIFDLPTYAQPSSTSDVTYVNDVIIVVPDTVMDLSYPSGEIPARLRFNWSTLEATSDGSIKQDSSMLEDVMDLEEALSEEESLSDATTEDGKTTVEITAAVTQDGNTISTNITEDTMNTAIESVLVEAAKEDTEPVVKIAVTTATTTDTLSVTLPETSLATLAESDGATLVIASDLGDIVLDQETMKAIAEQATGEITIEISFATEDGELSDAMMEVIGDATLIRLQILSDDNYISDFGGGQVNVTVPYTLQEGEVAENIVVFYVDENGNTTPRATTYDAENETVSFATGSFSYYMIGFTEEEIIIVDAWVNPFIDVSVDNWFYNAVQFVVETGLFSGTSENTFSPNAEMTRAMLTTVLWRLEGTPNRYSRGYSFADVTEDKYYYDSVLWSAENNLVSGYTNGLFGSNDSITREQLVVILYRYAQMKEAMVMGDTELADFTDAADIASYATDAFTWAVGTGLVSGVEEGRLAPKATSTRAQVALILQKYIALEESILTEEIETEA